jgi:hypothetical protein
LDSRLSAFPLVYKASTQEKRGNMPASTVVRRPLCLSCDMWFGASLDKYQSTSDNVTDVVDRLHDIHYHVNQHLRVDSDQTEPR